MCKRSIQFPGKSYNPFYSGRGSLLAVICYRFRLLSGVKITADG